MTPGYQVERFKKNVHHAWHGEEFTIAHVFLWLAVWNVLVAAINVTVWPRMFNLDALVYMKPANVVFPIIVCLIPVMLSRSIGLRPLLKATVVICIIGIATLVLWNPQSEAWLNQYGYHVL
jgi:hypothetical protein